MTATWPRLLSRSSSTTSASPSISEQLRDRFRGCLLAGAIGDALGAKVEFWPLSEIHRQLGPPGVRGFLGDMGEVTDDTQMTLFTAEGLIRASVRGRSKGICHVPSVVHHAYLRWLYTQGVGWAEAGARLGGEGPDGWLVAEGRLHHRRAPGNTCLSALHSGKLGATDQPLNDSKGCGGVMRVAPVGLLVGDPERAFQLGCEVAAITHGHPSGWLPAGALAAIVSHLAGGDPVAVAVQAARRLLLGHPSHGETLAALDEAVRLGRHGPPRPSELERLGGGWVGEEALAIAVGCALGAPDPRSAVVAAVNHSGDSDSTGAICGNIVGAAHGEAWLPREWVDRLELGDVVARIADDLWRERFEPPSGDDWWAQYPGW